MNVKFNLILSIIICVISEYPPISAQINNKNITIQQLNEKGLDFFEKRDYHSALSMFEKELEELEKQGAAGSNDHLSVLALIVSCKEETESYIFTWNSAKKLVDTAKNYKGDQSLDYAYALSKLAGVENKYGNFAVSIELYNQAINLYESIGESNTLDYVDCLRDCALAYRDLDDNPTRELEMLLKAERIFAKVKDARNRDISGVESILSSVYQELGDYQKAIDYAKITVNSQKKAGLSNTDSYAITLTTLCSALTKGNFFDEAISTGENAVNIAKNNAENLDRSRAYKGAIVALANAYHQSGSSDKAIRLLEGYIKGNFSDDREKLLIMQSLTVFYQDCGLKEKQRDICMNILPLAEKIDGKVSTTYAEALLMASMMQDRTGDAIIMLKEASSIIAKSYGKNSELYNRILSTINLLSTDITEYKDISSEQDSVLNNLRTMYGNDSGRFYTEYLSILCYRFYKASDTDRNFDLANQNFTEMHKVLSEIKEKLGDKNSVSLDAAEKVARVTAHVYELSNNIEIYNWADNTQTFVASQIASIYGENHARYIQAIEVLSRIKSIYLEKSQYDESVWNEMTAIRTLYLNGNIVQACEKYKGSQRAKLYQEAYNLQKKAVDFYRNQNRESSNYASSALSAANIIKCEVQDNPVFCAFWNKNVQDSFYSFFMPKMQEAHGLYKESLKIYEKLNDKTDIAYVHTFMAAIYQCMGEDIKAAECHLLSFESWKEETLSQFSMLTYNEKTQSVNNHFWQSTIEHYGRQATYQFINKDKSEKENNIYAELAYNAQLLSKGLLLNSELGLKDLAKGSTANCKALIFKLEEIRKKIDNSPSEEDAAIARKEYSSIERELMKESQQYGDYMENLRMTYKDIQRCLKEKELAIEFIADRQLDGNGNWIVNYYALTLKKDYHFPKVYKLGNKENLQIADSLFQKIWNPLMGEINNVSKVFFSPIYELNRLPLESVILPDGNIFADRGIQLYRLSSTREIAIARTKNRSREAVLYGGLRYDATVADLIASDAKERANGLRGITVNDYQLEEDIKRGRFRWDFLIDTETEIIEIDKVLNKKGFKSNVYRGIEGTESTFKNLSNKKIDILHIATHGFYIKSDNAQTEDMQLERSGLIIWFFNTYC